MECQIINKQLMTVKQGSYTRILPNIFEAVKVECIAASKGRLSKHLPYFRVEFDHDALPDLALWQDAFSSDNPPETIKFDERLEEMIREVDFSKPFDAAVAETICQQFVVKSRVKANVDADLMIQGELGELDEQ